MTYLDLRVALLESRRLKYIINLSLNEIICREFYFQCQLEKNLTWNCSQQYLSTKINLPPSFCPSHLPQAPEDICQRFKFLRLFRLEFCSLGSGGGGWGGGDNVISSFQAFAQDLPHVLFEVLLHRHRKYSVLMHKFRSKANICCGLLLPTEHHCILSWRAFRNHFYNTILVEWHNAVFTVPNSNILKLSKEEHFYRLNSKQL